MELLEQDRGRSLMSHVVNKLCLFSNHQLFMNLEFNFLVKKWKTCSVFLSSYKNTCGNMGEQEIKSLVYFENRNVNFLCSHHHYANSSY